MDQTSVYQVAQEHVGEDRPLLSIIMETASDEFDDAIRIVEIMENMSANGINAEEVGQSLQEVESMKQKVQDSIDGLVSMVLNGDYEESSPDQSAEGAELIAKINADFKLFQLKMAEAVEACRFTPHCKTEPDIPPPPSMPTDVAKSSKPGVTVFTDRRVSFESMETEKPVGSDTASLEPVAEKLDQNSLEFQGAAMPMVDLASPERMLKSTDKYSRDNLENTKKKLGEFRAHANALDMIVPGVVEEQNHDGSGSGWRSHALSIEESSEEESEREDHDDDSAVVLRWMRLGLV